MKRLLVSFLLLSMTLSFCGCTQHTADITAEDIVVAYEAAGYRVSSKLYDETLEHGQIGYVQADHPDGDYIYFAIFENKEAAKAYKKEFYHPAMLGLFSAIFGDPSWQRWEVYGSFVVQYDHPMFMKPFKDLLRSK